MANAKKTTTKQDNVAEEVTPTVDGATEVNTKLGTSPEEKAAERAGVPDERLKDPIQNREPKNKFEQENQKVTDVERKAAQKVSDMTTKERVENSETPNEIASAIAEGFKKSKEDQFALQPEVGIDHRFTVVKNSKTGEVMLRENETGHLSKVQLLSLEEKEASIQGQEVEEL